MKAVIDREKTVDSKWGKASIGLRKLLQRAFLLS